MKNDDNQDDITFCVCLSRPRQLFIYFAKCEKKIKSRHFWCLVKIKTQILLNGLRFNVFASHQVRRGGGYSNSIATAAATA